MADAARDTYLELIISRAVDSMKRHPRTSTIQTLSAPFFLTKETVAFIIV